MTSSGRRKRWAFILAILGIFVLPMISYAKVKLPKPNDTWFKGESPNFTVYSNAPEKSVRRALNELEEFRAAISANTKGMRLTSPLPTHIFLFKNDIAFRPYKLGPDGKPRTIAGFFQPREHANFVALDLAAGLGVIYHEYAHYFLSNSVPGLPLWADEGIAEYYSTFKATKTKQELGQPHIAHAYWLSRNSMQPIMDLFAVNARSPEYNERNRKGTFYAQSWALTHFLLTRSDESREKFGKWVTEIQKGQDANVTFWQIFETTPEDLLKELEDYVRIGRYSYYPRPAIQVPESEITMTPLEHVDTLALLGDMLANKVPLDNESADAHLKAALKEDPKHVGATLALARLRLNQMRLQEADALFAKAVELGPNNADAHAALGVRKLRQWYDSNPPSRMTTLPPIMLEARNHFKKALELNPEQPDAMRWIGKTYFMGDDAEEGINLMIAALKVFPSDVNLIGDLIVTFANAGHIEYAEQWYEEALVRRSRDPHQVRSVARVILGGRVNRAVSLANEGKYDEAIARLEKISQEDTGAMQSQIDSMLVRFKQNQFNRMTVDLYNEGVNLSNEGNYEEALAKINALLEMELNDASLKSAAESLKTRLEEYVNQ